MPTKKPRPPQPPDRRDIAKWIPTIISVVALIITLLSVFANFNQSYGGLKIRVNDLEERIKPLGTWSENMVKREEYEQLRLQVENLRGQTDRLERWLECKDKGGTFDKGGSTSCSPAPPPSATPVR